MRHIIVFVCALLSINLSSIAAPLNRVLYQTVIADDRVNSDSHDLVALDTSGEVSLFDKEKSSDSTPPEGVKGNIFNNLVQNKFQIDKQKKFKTYTDESGIKESETLQMQKADVVDSITVTSMGIKNRDAATVVPANVKDGEEFKDSEYKDSFKIIKYYQLYDAVLGDVLETGTYATLNATHDILIKDEQKYNNFKLKEWFITDNDWDDVEDKDILTQNLYADNKKNFNILQEGTEEDIIHIPVEEAGTKKALHILYRYEPINMQFVVHKIYLNGERIEKVEDSTLIKNIEGITNIRIPGYKCLSIREYREAIEFPDSLKQQIEDPTALNEFNAKDIDSYLPLEDVDVKVATIQDRINLDPDYPEIYIVYLKDTVDEFILYSNEISHVYKLSQLNSQPVTVYNYIQSALDGGASPPVCNGHILNDRTYYCNNYQNGKRLIDAVITLSIEDKFDYAKESTNIAQYRVLHPELLKKTYTTSWKGGNGEVLKLYPDAELTLYRDSTIDPLTLYPEKNSSEVLQRVAQFRLGDPSYVPKERGLTHNYTDENLYSTLETHWETAEDSDNILTWEWKLHNKIGTHFFSEQSKGSYKVNYEIGHSPDDANVSFGKENNVVTKYYKSSDNTIESTGQESPYILKNKAPFVRVLDAGKFVYYPYTEYDFEYIGDNDTVHKDKVFITEDMKNEVLTDTIALIMNARAATWHEYLGEESEVYISLHMPYADAAYQEAVGNKSNLDAADSYLDMLGISDKAVSKKIIKDYKYFTDDSYTVKLTDGTSEYPIDTFDYFNNLGCNIKKSLSVSANTFNRYGNPWLKLGFYGLNYKSINIITQSGKPISKSVDFIK